MTASFQDIDQVLNASQNELENLINSYPMVAIYRAALAKKLKSSNSHSYHEVLKSTALHVPDRKYLYHFLNKKETEVESKTEIVSLVEEERILSANSEVTQEISKEKVTQVEPDLKTEESKGELNEVAENSKEVIKEEGVFEKITQSEVKEITEEEIETIEVKKEDVVIESEEEEDEEHSFEDWLNFLDDHEIDEKEDELSNEIEVHHAAATYNQELKEELEVEQEVDDESEELSLSATKKVKTLAKNSITLKSGSITETLAKIMLMQGKINEAISAYEQLSLKFPEKSNYFAAEIQKIKKK